jgi:hypothetical protein
MRGVMPIVDVSIATVDGVVRTVVALSHERRCMHYCTVLHCTALYRKVMHCAPHHSPRFVYCTVLYCAVQNGCITHLICIVPCICHDAAIVTITDNVLYCTSLSTE